jgi:hypothetical protein
MATLESRLKPARRSAALWDSEEDFVREEFQRLVSARQAREKLSRGMGPACVRFLRELFWPGPVYYAGLAVVWVLLLAMSPRTGALPKETSSSAQAISAELRVALWQQRQELRELLGTPESVAAKPAARPAAPRSELEGRPKDAALGPDTPHLDSYRDEVLA